MDLENHGYEVSTRLVEELAIRQLAQVYRKADPFPHTVIDGFLSEDFLDEVVHDFDAIPDSHWQVFEKEGYAYKLECREMEHLGSRGRQIFYELNSPPFLRYLEKLTGITGLVPDPYLMGAGFHKIPRGGKLAVHADFNWYEHFKLYRRVNLLCYLNKEWQDDYNGHLELWDKTLEHCVKRVAPVFNRAVIFNTTDSSFHGYPGEIQCPEGMHRKAVTLYYYTNGRPEEEAAAPHKTIWKET